jgi:hypothetical protein
LAEPTQQAPNASDAYEVIAARQVRSGSDGIARDLRAKVEAANHVSPPVLSRFAHPQTEANEHDFLKSGQSRLYPRSAQLKLAHPPALSSAEQPQAAKQSSPARSPVAIQPLQPQLDIGRLSEEVYWLIQRKIRVERERRGI